MGISASPNMKQCNLNELQKMSLSWSCSYALTASTMYEPVCLLQFANTLAVGSIKPFSRHNTFEPQANSIVLPCRFKA